MDKQTFCDLYNRGKIDKIITVYCTEKGKTEAEVSMFITALQCIPGMLIEGIIDFIIDDISKTEPVTFLINQQQQIIKAF